MSSRDSAERTLSRKIELPDGSTQIAGRTPAASAPSGGGTTTAPVTANAPATSHRIHRIAASTCRRACRQDGETCLPLKAVKPRPNGLLRCEPKEAIHAWWSGRGDDVRSFEADLVGGLVVGLVLGGALGL